MRKPLPPAADVAWAWFFDIDGTLVEIAATPSSVVVHHDLPHLITELAKLTGRAVSLITGRSVSDASEILPVEGVSIAGQHGSELQTSSGIVNTGDANADFSRIEEELSALTAKHRALIVEHKGNSVALHYRKAPHLAGYAHRFMRSLQARYATGLELQKGKKVVELRPRGADKGLAIQRLMSRPPFKGRRPVFVGDDVTDEAGFKAVNAMRGVSVKVGAGFTEARYRLRDVNAVREWIAHGLHNSMDAKNGIA